MGDEPRSRRRRRLADIIAYIASTREIVTPLTRDEFLGDAVKQKAACFDLLCISEATARLLDLDADVAGRHPNVPWHQVRAIANILRHEYNRIDMSIVWDTVTGGDLDTLATAVSTELGEPMA